MKRIMAGLMAALLALCALLESVPKAGAEGSAPVAENLELRTYRNISVGGRMSAFDPDGGSLRFQITTEPVKGQLTAEEDGTFLYTPRQGKKGRDYFGYKAMDEQGNVSQEATVIIRIEKRKNDVFYADLQGREEEYAAAVLDEDGLFTGEKIGGTYCFFPERAVSRGEFLSLCMEISGYPIYAGVIRTGYRNDEAIPAWLKDYAASAALFGVETGEVLDPDETVTVSEAAEQLDRALHVTRVSYSAPGREQTQACMNLSAAGLLREGEDTEQMLTRAKMAQMLCAALELLERR